MALNHAFVDLLEDDGYARGDEFLSVACALWTP